MDIWDAICQVGFPIVVAIYLLARLEPKVDAMGKHVDSVNSSILMLIEVVKDDVANTKSNADATKDFTKAIEDLKTEIRRFNNGNNKK